MWGVLVFIGHRRKRRPCLRDKVSLRNDRHVCLHYSIKFINPFLNYDTICFEYQFERVLVFRFKVLSFTIIYQKSINLKTREY